MRVAFLTLATEGGASPRYRVYQYVPRLERAGIRCAVFPAVSAGTSSRFYGKERAWTNASYQAIELIGRLAQLPRVRRFDVVVVQKALLTVGIRGLDALAVAAARRLVVDVDDAVHLSPPHRLPSWLRVVEDPSQPARLMARARAVVAGSERLAASLRPLNPGVAVVPTSVDTDRISPGLSRRRRTPVLGWIGSPSTAPYLEAIGPVLSSLARRTPFLLRVVGGPPPAPPGVPVEARAWDPSRELSELRGFDVGLMPLPDTPWTSGKCGLKAVQYLAAGVPAVCSPVGAAPEIVRHGHEGYLARSPEEWEEALFTLLADPGLRRHMGEAARARAESRYSVSVNAPKLASILEAAVA